MAVPEQTPYSEHTGNGVTKSFALGFICESKDHLIVLVDEIEPPIATWSLSGGNVVFTTAPASGSKITIQRNTPFSRTVDYQSYNNSFRPQSVNGDFDRLWLKLQELGVADWLMKLYVDRLHQQQEQKINDLKVYVDDRDDELRAYLMEEIRKQGVALDQLDEYYNYLMQRLAQIAVDKGWDASFVVDGTQTQAEINLYGGKKYDMPVGGYPIGAEVLLDNGEKVKSTIPNNTNDPNTNISGWVNTGARQEAKNAESISTKDYGSAAIGQNIPVSDWYTIGTTYYRGYSYLADVQVDYPHVTSATNTVDWAAAQKACDVAGVGNDVLIEGCLFFSQGEKLATKARQRLRGHGSPLFINTNNGLMFTGSLTGTLPKAGIYYDGEIGAGLRCAEATILEDLHIFGKGLKVADGTINILQIHDAEYHPTTGIEVEKFITTINTSIMYFDAAMHSIGGGGNYYSRHFNLELTRCSVGLRYSSSAYNQDFFGVIMREVREPLKFENGAFARCFQFFGGSIEGYRPQVGFDYAVGIPANSLLSFKGTYFENLEDSGVFESVFTPVGTNAVIQFSSCTVYLNHYNNFVKQPNQTGFKVVSQGNEFIVSGNSRVKNPTIYNIQQQGQNIATINHDGSDKIRFVRGYPNIQRSATLTSGSKTAVFADVTDIHVGQRVIVSPINLETVITEISGNNVILQAASTSNYTGSVDIYFTPSYLPFSIGLPSLNNRIRYPDDYLSYFDDIQFDNISGMARRARATAPNAPFNGAASGVATYIANGSTWNPANRAVPGSYPVAYTNGRYVPMLGSFTGSFTFPAGTSAVVPNTNVTGTSKVVPIPTNAAAATLMKNGWYISAKNNATSFVMTTQTTALGTETFDYTVTD